MTMGLVASLVLLQAGCSSSVQRPGNSFDGSAFWARDIAQPLITAFAADAQIFNISGTQVFSDGRLPRNVGVWSINAWSPSRQEEFQVKVKYDGTTSTITRSQTTGPSSNGQPLPSGWVNSTTVFDATASHRDPGATVAAMALFNNVNFSGPHWGLNFNTGTEPNHYVNFDGTYLGTTP